MLSQSKSKEDQRKLKKIRTKNPDTIICVTSESDEETAAKKTKLRVDDKEVKDSLDVMKRTVKKRPRLVLNSIGQAASFDLPLSQRTPIVLDDVKNLVMNLYFGCPKPHDPWRWGTMKKISRVSHSVVVFVSECSGHLNESEVSKLIPDWNTIFPVRLDTVLLSDPKDSVDMFLKLPLLDMNRKQLIEQYGSLDAALQMDFEVLSRTTPYSPTKSATVNDDAFDRTKLLLSPLQMVVCAYPVPLKGVLAYRYHDYSFTKDVYDPVTPRSPMFGVDCEMCKTTLGVNEITRISIVDEAYKSVYETFVKPENKIIDYMTSYSGVTADMLIGVTKTLTEVHADLKKLLPPDAILVGQSLNVDLNCMKVFHPYVIDTSVLFNISGVRPRKAKLKTLARQFLDETIQDNIRGHDSIEDSITALKLVHLKLSKSESYGDMVLINLERQNRYEDLPNQRRAFIAASQNCTYDYTRYGTKLSTMPESSSTGASVNFHEFLTNAVCLKRVAGNCPEHDYSFCHVDLSEGAKSLAESLQELHKGITTIHTQLARNGCLVVVFGGTTDNPKEGATFVCIKD